MSLCLQRKWMTTTWKRHSRVVWIRIEGQDAFRCSTAGLFSTQCTANNSSLRVNMLLLRQLHCPSKRHLYMSWSFESMNSCLRSTYVCEFGAKVMCCTAGKFQCLLLVHRTCWHRSCAPPTCCYRVSVSFDWTEMYELFKIGRNATVAALIIASHFYSVTIHITGYKNIKWGMCVRVNL